MLSTSPALQTVSMIHPLTSLRPEEIVLARDIVAHYNSGKQILWRIIAVKEPPKAQVVPQDPSKILSNRSFLEAEHVGRTAIPPPRVIYTNFYFHDSPNFHEALVDIGAGRVLWQRNLGTKVHAPGTFEEMERMHGVAIKGELVLEELKRLKLVPGTEVICEPWPYGKDGINDDDRLFQVYSSNDASNYSATSF